ncbi:unnamed protein product [Closterium sp. NIES-53]
MSRTAPAPPATADSATRSQWLTRDAAAYLAIRNHLPLALCAHFRQHRTAETLYHAVVARYSSPATTSLGRLLLPYLFPELCAFATVEDLGTLSRAARGTPRTPFFEGYSPSPLASSYASVVEVLSTEDVGATSASAKRRSSKGKGGRGGEGGSGSGGGGSSGGSGGSGGGGSGGSGAGSGGAGGGGGGSGGSGGSGSGGSGGGRTGAQRGGSGGGQWQRQQHQSETPSPQQLRSSLYILDTEPPQILMWHHRLGHPSLPRLRDMHSRLLVSSLPRSLPPLLPSPAPPCLPCVKGRQRAAPHSSSFPPMTAPLQTLHLDMWGPARLSGQGRERYFLLVVDDYTRYTMVFPLRSKGQVVDVLIPWISAVHLQLRERFRADLPVLRLHSDRGGEFSSDLLRDFCRGEGILQSFTLPDSPHQNGISEHRIGIVMEVARTSMIHAAAPHFLWPFAVWYPAHQLNLWPRVSLPETSPTLRWAGKVGDASVFRDITFDESVPFYHLFPYGSAPPPAPWLFLAPGPPPVNPLPPQGLAPSGVSQVDCPPSTAPVEVAFGSGAARGAASGGAASRGAEPGVAESEQLREWLVRRARLWSGATGPGGAGAAGARGAGVTAGAGCTGGTAAAGLGNACTRGTGAAGTGGVGGARARDPTQHRAAGAGGSGAGDAGAGGAGSRGTGARGARAFPLAPSYASAAAFDVRGAEDVRAASASGKCRSSKGKGGRGGGGGSSGGGGGSGALAEAVVAAVGVAVVAAVGVVAVGLELLSKEVRRWPEAATAASKRDPVAPAAS